MKNSEQINRRAALIAACTTSFMVPYFSSAVNIALPAIGAEFHLPAITMGWVTTAFLVAAASFLLPFGKLGDMTGRRRIYLIGISLYTFFAAVAAMAPSGGFLIAASAVLGVSAAMIFGTAIAILTSVSPPKESGRVLGIAVSFTYAGLSLGPLFGGFLTQTIGWRSVYLFNVPIGIIAIVFIAFRLKGEWKGAESTHFDGLGALISAVSLGLLVYGFSILPKTTGFVLVAVSLVGLVLFLLHERQAENALLPLALFKGNRAFAMSNLAALINYSATFALTFFLSLYLQYIQGLNARTAGLVLVAQPVMMALLSPLAGRLSDKHQPRVLASAGMAIMAVMLGLLSTIGYKTSLVLIMVELLFIGIGYAFFSSPNTNAIMGSVDRQFYGVASATVGSMRLIGQMMSMGIAILAIHLIIGNVSITPDLYPQFLKAVHLCFAIFSFLCLLGVFASLARGNRAEPEVD